MPSRIHTAALQSVTCELVENIELYPIMDKLFSKHVITHQKWDEIRSVKVRHEGVRSLLSTVFSTTDDKFYVFKEVLGEYYPHFADKLSTAITEFEDNPHLLSDVVEDNLDFGCEPEKSNAVKNVESPDCLVDRQLLRHLSTSPDVRENWYIIGEKLGLHKQVVKIMRDVKLREDNERAYAIFGKWMELSEEAELKRRCLAQTLLELGCCDAVKCFSEPAQEIAEVACQTMLPIGEFASQTEETAASAEAHLESLRRENVTLGSLLEKERATMGSQLKQKSQELVETKDKLRNLRKEFEEMRELSRRMQLEKRAKAEGLRIVNNTGGDNGFFLAVVDQLYGTYDLAQLKVMVADELHKREDEVFRCGPGNRESYMENLTENREWAVNVALYTLSQAMNRTFIVLSSRGKEHDVVMSPNAQSTIEQGPPIKLGHIIERHYVSLRQESDDAEFPWPTPRMVQEARREDGAGQLNVMCSRRGEVTLCPNEDKWRSVVEGDRWWASCDIILPAALGGWKVCVRARPGRKMFEVLCFLGDDEYNGACPRPYRAHVALQINDARTGENFMTCAVNAEWAGIGGAVRVIKCVPSNFSRNTPPMFVFIFSRFHSNEF